MAPCRSPPLPTTTVYWLGWPQSQSSGDFLMFFSQDLAFPGTGIMTALAPLPWNSKRSQDVAKQKCSLKRTIILINWGGIRAVWGNFYPFFYQEEQLTSMGLRASINAFFSPCLGFFIKPQWHFCQHRVRITLHRLIVFVRTVWSLQQRHFSHLE